MEDMASPEPPPPPPPPVNRQFVRTSAQATVDDPATRAAEARGAVSPAVTGGVASTATAAVASTVYFFAGPTLIFLNAQILKSCGFPYPITLSMCGVLFSALVSHVALRTGFVPFGRPDLLGSSRFYLRSSLPIGCLSALTLGLGNMAYLHLSVASCQILKTLTPVITLGLGSLLGIERTTPRLAACVMLICLGTMVASQGELAMAGVGVALQLGANLSEAARMVLSQQLLASHKLPLLELQYHVAPSQAACLLFAALLFELNSKADRAAALTSLVAHPLSFIAASSLGMVMQVATLVVVRVSGPVTVKLLGIVRNAAIVLTEVGRGNTQGTPQQLAGYSLSLAAFGCYTWLRMQGGKRPKAA